MSVQRCTCTDRVSVQRMQRSDMYKQCCIKYFYRAKLRVARYCQGKLSVRPSVYLSVCL